MKPSRRLQLTQEFIDKYNLSTSPPPPSSLFWKMWNACSSIAQSALATKYIQGIKNGNLDPVTYGAFVVNDAYYCFNGPWDYLVAANNTTDVTLNAFLMAKFKSYLAYNHVFAQTWHLWNGLGIMPMSVTQNYAEFERNVATLNDPIYTLVVMIPCEYLWYWLASQMSPVNNLYADWINGNNDPSGAYAIGNFLNQYTGTLDPTIATNLYTQAMNFEQQGFAAGA